MPRSHPQRSSYSVPRTGGFSKHPRQLWSAAKVEKDSLSVLGIAFIVFLSPVPRLWDLLGFCLYALFLCFDVTSCLIVSLEKTQGRQMRSGPSVWDTIFTSPPPRPPLPAVPNWIEVGSWVLMVLLFYFSVLAPEQSKGIWILVLKGAL